MAEEESVENPGEPEEPDYKALWEAEKANSRKWEGRAKQNKSAASELEKAKDEQDGTSKKLEDAVRRANEAETEAKRLKDAAERAAVVAEVASAEGVDRDLLAAMRGETREDVEASAKLVKQRLSAMNPYPIVNDGGAKTPQPLGPKEISKIKNPAERVMARAQNMKSY